MSTTPCLARWNGPTVNLKTPDGAPAGVLPTGAEVRLVYPGMISPSDKIPMLFAVPAEQVEPAPTATPAITADFIEGLLDDPAAIEQIASILSAKPMLMQRIIATVMAQQKK